MLLGAVYLASSVLTHSIEATHALTPPCLHETVDGSTKPRRSAGCGMEDLALKPDFDEVKRVLEDL